MNRRSRVGVAALSLSVLLTFGMAGCARKAVQAPPESPPRSSTTIGQAEATPVPSSVANGTSESLQAVFYAFDSYRLDDAARQTLNRHTRMLRENPDFDVTIEGHCDERGTAEYNQALGERRARAARDYLIASGVAPGRIRVVSFGKERPFTHGHDEAAWASNRRAHFVGP